MVDASHDPVPGDSEKDLAAAIEEGSPLLFGRQGTSFDRVVDAFLVLSGVLVLLGALSVSFNVVSRAALGQTYTWVFEYAEFALVFIVFLAISGVARTDGHVRMDLIDEVLKARWRARLSVITDALSALIALLLTVASAWVTWGNFQAGTTIGLLSTPRWIALAIVPVGSAVLFVQLLRTLRYNLRRLA